MGMTDDNVSGLTYTDHVNGRDQYLIDLSKRFRRIIVIVPSLLQTTTHTTRVKIASMSLPF